MQHDSGFIALLSLLIIGGLTLVIAVGLAFRSVDESKMSQAREFAASSRHVATACAEQALKNIKDNKNYNGGETLIFGSVSCEILPVVKNGPDRTVKTQSTVSGFTKKVLLEVKTGATLQVLSWQDVPDF